MATGDVHFLDHHEMFRRILQTNKGFEDAEAQAPLLRTTEEMLRITWLGQEKAHQIVVENSRQMDQVESLAIPDGNFQYRRAERRSRHSLAECSPHLRNRAARTD